MSYPISFEEQDNPVSDMQNGIHTFTLTYYPSEQVRRIVSAKKANHEPEVTRADREQLELLAFLMGIPCEHYYQWFAEEMERQFLPPEEFDMPELTGYDV